MDPMQKCLTLYYSLFPFKLAPLLNLVLEFKSKLMARLMPEICEQRGHSTLFLRDVKGACCITEVYNGSKIRVCCTVVAPRLDKIQSPTQSPQALWPAVGRLETLVNWDFITAGSLW